MWTLLRTGMGRSQRRDWLLSPSLWVGWLGWKINKERRVFRFFVRLTEQELFQYINSSVSFQKRQKHDILYFDWTFETLFTPPSLQTWFRVFWQHSTLPLLNVTLNLIQGLLTIKHSAITPWMLKDVQHDENVWIIRHPELGSGSFDNIVPCHNSMRCWNKFSMTVTVGVQYNGRGVFF